MKKKELLLFTSVTKPEVQDTNFIKDKI